MPAPPVCVTVTRVVSEDSIFWLCFHVASDVRAAAALLSVESLEAMSFSAVCMPEAAY
jgi:hypothetical protein